jgi:ABC-2 type transport system ATP-binding protein
MIANGTVAELQARAGNLWQVTLEQSSSFAWLTALPDIQVTSATGNAAQFLVQRDGAEQQVLQAAATQGPVSSFGRHRIPLADLFRDAVTVPAVDEN